MRIVFLGTRRLGYEGLRLLIEMRETIVSAFTFDHEITEGRTSSDLAALCDAHGIRLHVTEDLDAYLDAFRAAAPDLLVSLFWKRIVSRAVLQTARLGGVNVHQSLLPRYRGYAPQNWAILRGDRWAGVTLHWMVPRADAGDIIDQRTYEIGPDETVGDLGDRARALALEMLRERLPQLALGTAPRIRQREASASEAYPRVPQDGWIDWQRPSAAIHDLIRAVSHPYPGAFTFRAGHRLYVWRSRLRAPDLAFAAMPGTVLRRSADGAWVSTGDGALELLRVQAEGSDEVAAGQLLTTRGERLGIDLVADVERLRRFLA